MQETIEIGTISSRGQIAIPANMRKKMNLKEGQKVVFFLGNDMLIVKKVMPETFAEITKPLQEAAKRVGLSRRDVQQAIQEVRRKHA